MKFAASAPALVLGCLASAGNAQSLDPHVALRYEVDTPPAHQAERGLRAVGADISRRRSEERIEAGLVSSELRDMQHDFETHFTIDRSAFERARGAADTPFQIQPRDVVRYVRDELERQSQVASTRSHEDLSRTPPQYGSADGEPFLPENDLLNAPTRVIAAHVQLAHGEGGRIESIELVRSSGNREVDRRALSAARSVAEDAPVRRDRPGITRWSFEVIDVITRWASQAGRERARSLRIGIQGTFGSPSETQVAAFGRGILRTRVRLLVELDADATEAVER